MGLKYERKRSGENCRGGFCTDESAGEEGGVLETVQIARRRDHAVKVAVAWSRLNTCGEMQFRARAKCLTPCILIKSNEERLKITSAHAVCHWIDTTNYSPLMLAVTTTARYEFYFQHLSLFSLVSLSPSLLLSLPFLVTLLITPHRFASIHRCAPLPSVK